MTDRPGNVTPIRPIDMPWYRHKNNIFIVFLIPALAYSLISMFKGWNGSLIEIYGFRQTQTAITVDYMLKGGGLLNYETPVLGPPWNIPLEFPFYQLIVYLLVKVTGYPLDQAGKLISVLFFLSSLYPLYALTKAHLGDKTRAIILLLLFSLSPQYIFWSRSFMIESAALAMSLWYVYFISDYVGEANNTRKHLLLGLMLVFGIIASITKVTTFFSYYVFAGLIVILSIIPSIRNVGFASTIKRHILLLLFGFIVPFAAIVVWTHYTDTIKAMNPVGTKLMSSSLTAWNFGTIQQKFSIGTWKKIFATSTKDLFGDVRILALFLLLPFCRKQTIVASLFLLMMFILPIAVFTNLFFVHSYYVYANGIVLIAALALIIGDIGTRGTVRYLVSIILIALISVTCIRHYSNKYLPMQGNQFRFQTLKWFVDTNTKPDDILVYFGADWSSEMPYYTNRRASMFPDSLTTKENFIPAVFNLRPYRIGGVLFCGHFKADTARKAELLGNLGLYYGGRTIYDVTDRCDVYFPNKVN